MDPKNIKDVKLWISPRKISKVSEKVSKNSEDWSKNCEKLLDPWRGLEFLYQKKVKLMSNIEKS